MRRCERKATRKWLSSQRVCQIKNRNSHLNVDAFLHGINGNQTSGEFLGLVFMNWARLGWNFCSCSIDLCTMSWYFKLQSFHRARHTRGVRSWPTRHRCGWTRGTVCAPLWAAADSAKRDWVPWHQKRCSLCREHFKDRHSHPGLWKS